MVYAYLDPGSGSMLLQLVVLGVILLLFIAGALLVVRVVRRGSMRPCPRCGTRVKAGHLDCQNCGFDFRTIGAQQPS